MDAFFWAADKSGCGFYRCGLPAAGLRELGHNVHASTVLSPEEFGWVSVDEIDVLIGQRVANPGSTKGWNQHYAHLPRLMEMDDDLFTVHRTNPAHGYFQHEGIRQNLARNLRNCDGVIVTNDHLAEQMSQYNPKTFVIPNFVPESLLAVQRTPNERLTIGWSGGASHEIDFQKWEVPIRNVLAKHKDVKLKIGAWDIRKRLGRPLDEYVDWTDDFDAYYRTLTWDIGFIPLADTVFNRSKSYLKFLEQAALGIPVVAANVGPYAEAIDHGVNGLLANSKAEMKQYLSDLITDESLRTQIGQNARKWATDHTIEGNAYRWLEALEQTK